MISNRNSPTALERLRGRDGFVGSSLVTDEIEALLIAFGKYHHIGRLRSRPGVFFYMVLDRGRSPLETSRIAPAEAKAPLDL